jgi:carboxymethylenebutenolidase
MEPTKPKLPIEAINLYNVAIHGGMSRREFMDGLKKYAVGGLTAAAMAEALMPNYALGQVVPKNDDRIKASYETVPSPSGNAARTNPHLHFGMYYKGTPVNPYPTLVAHGCT